MIRRSLWCGVMLWALSAWGDPRATLSQVEQRLDDWDLPGAVALLEGLERELPSDSQPLQYLRGRIAFEEGRYDQAIALLRSAGVPDSPESYLRLARDTAQVTHDHRHLESEHFIFSFPGGKDELLAPYALETLEAARAALLKDLGFAPPGKTRVEVVNDAPELSRVSTLTLKQIQTTGTIAICKFNKLMVTSPKAVVRGYDWLDTLAHEYVHLVVSSMSHNTVPIWLHEGLAKYLESRWRGEAGLSIAPATLALLGRRVQQDTLVPFEKMHPSIAMLPTAEDAAVAFAEVFFAVDYLFRERGNAGLQTVIGSLRDGKTDRQAVEAATGMTFARFEKAWIGHIRQQPLPRELIPQTGERIVLKDAAKKTESDPREIDFQGFDEVVERDARKLAHLGELFRERSRFGAAAEEYGKAHRLVGDKYESISNKYALTLIQLKRLDEAEGVLRGSLKVHPGAAASQVHLGRIYLARGDDAHALETYLGALASDPFDEEIHLALAAVHGELGHAALRDRALKAVELLMGLNRSQAEALAGKLADQRANRQRSDAGTP